MAGFLARILVWLGLLCASALAQDIPNHSVPIGKGPGVVGFGSTGPCLGALAWQGPTSDPACSTGPSTTGISLYVATTGSDSNNCTDVAAPCLTISHAIEVCFIGWQCTINLAAGTYTTTTGYNIFYHRTVNIVGNCSDHTAVTVNLAGNSLTLFTVQDFAISQMGCFTVTTNGTGNTIAVARQFAIVDFDSVIIASNFTSGVMLASNNASMNCGGTVQVTAAIPAFAAWVIASNVGLLTFVCSVTITNAGSTGLFFTASGKSKILATTATFAGNLGTAGGQCYIADSTLDRPATIPGTASTCVPVNGGVIN